LLMLRLATGVIEVLTVDVLLLESGSFTPAAGVAVAVFEMLPVADPLTVAVIVTTTEAPAGNVGTLPLTVLPESATDAGQTAPPLAEPQLAAVGSRFAFRISEKLVLFAALGPVLLI
jgi:hypothetical protein